MGAQFSLLKNGLSPLWESEHLLPLIQTGMQYISSSSLVGVSKLDRSHL